LRQNVSRSGRGERGWKTEDRDDIEAVLQANPGLDTARVRSWVEQFAEALEMPEILSDLEVQLARGDEARRRPEQRR
jgi:hypothetical protein